MLQSSIRSQYSFERTFYLVLVVLMLVAFGAETAGRLQAGAASKELLAMRGDR